MDLCDENKPWFKLDPTNFSDRWWLYTSIKNHKSTLVPKTDEDIECHFIIQDCNASGTVTIYRISTWYKNDINRYLNIGYDLNWFFDKKLCEMMEGDIVMYDGRHKYKVYNSKFTSQDLYYRDYCKILVRIE